MNQIMKKIFTILIYTVLTSTFCYITAQTNNSSSISQENKKIKKEQFQNAIIEAKKTLEENPSRSDLLISIANNYAWQEKNDSALIYIMKAQEANYYNDDLFDSWLNILLWSHQYQNMLVTCDLAEKYKYSHTENLFRKRIIAYSELRMYEEGLNLAEQPNNKNYLKFEDINYIYNVLLVKRNTNIISAYYSLDFFNNYSPQHLVYLGYSMPIGKHTLALRANYAYRFGENDVQLESDFYLQMHNKTYMYFNYGYAFNGQIFPRHRIGYEFYFPLMYKMEASLGGRFMSYATSKVYILTGHIEKYMGKSWVALRPFYVIQKDTQSFSLLGDYRLYNKNPLNYWEAELSYGNSPDESYANIQSATYNNLDAYKIKFSKNSIIGKVSTLKIGLGYSWEEFRSNDFRSRYTFEIQYNFRFK